MTEKYNPKSFYNIINWEKKFNIYKLDLDWISSFCEYLEDNPKWAQTALNFPRGHVCEQTKMPLGAMLERDVESKSLWIDV